MYLEPLPLRLARKMTDFVREISHWECECIPPEDGEDGTIECFGCRARDLIRKSEEKP